MTDDLRGSRRSSPAPCGEGLRHTSLINYAPYQAGWFACVLGASRRRPGVGLSIALVLIGAHVVLSSERHVEVGLVLFATVVGTAGGPIAFIAGQRLGAVTLLPPVTHSLLRLSRTWAIALVAFSVVVCRVTPDGQGPGYHASWSP